MTTTRATIAKIHIAKKELALVDESYRAILVRITGKDSSGACTDAELEKVLAEFRRLGWKPKQSKPASDKPHVRKIFALWNEACRAGAIQDTGRDALRAFVRRQTGKDDPNWLSPTDANKMTEALKAMIARAEAKR
jgi:phage gp16-like protein